VDDGTGRAIDSRSRPLQTEGVRDGMDAAVRSAAFDWLREQTDFLDDTIPWSTLQRGFVFRDRRVPLVSMQGIFKPRILDWPLSIRTAHAGPYDDQIDADRAFITYRYRGDNPQHPDNVGLREVMSRRLPLVYLYGVGGGRYEPLWPAYIRDDDPTTLSFRVFVDAVVSAPPEETSLADDRQDARREYVTVAAKYRLHQRLFRESVLGAYQERCAVCRLRHRELLDGAHIVEDAEGGPPTVPNGLALCKLHHAAYDKYVIGIHPETLGVEVRSEVLEEVDGPMLTHGLQGVHGTQIALPRRVADRPQAAFLAQRYERYRAA
jgi:putative restriction endonuclease